jgi:hypothetical protein
VWSDDWANAGDTILAARIAAAAVIFGLIMTLLPDISQKRSALADQSDAHVPEKFAEAVLRIVFLKARNNRFIKIMIWKYNQIKNGQR